MRLRILYGLLFILLIAGCSEEQRTNEENAQNDETTISFSEALQSISFYGYPMLPDPLHEFSEIPERIVVHEDVYSIRFNINASKEEVDQLLKQIKVEGTSQYTIEEEEEGNYLLRLQHFDETVIVKLGDLPAITVQRLTPLQVDIVKNAFKYPFHTIKVPEYGQVSVKASEHEQQLTLTFSEPMDRAIPSEMLPAGEWIDDQTYMVDIQRTNLTTDEAGSIPLGHLQSKSGNYVSHTRGFPKIVISWVKDTDWVNIETKDRVGWSERDFLYDSIIYSPDESQYIGTIAMPYDNGHHTDYKVALVLERNGKPPYTIEEGIDGLLRTYSSVQWLDNKRLLFADAKHVYVYDLEKNERTVLHDWSEQEGELQHVVYDRMEDKLLMITVKPDNQSEEYRYLYDKVIYDNLDQLLLRDENFTSAEIVIWPNIPQMPVHITENGYYWTITKNGEMTTIFEGRDGRTEEAAGKVIYADNDHVYLLVNTYLEPNRTLKQTLVVWEYGKSPKAAEDPPGGIRMAGSIPIAYRHNKEYYLYDRSTDSWELFESQKVQFSQHDQIGMMKLFD